MDDANAATTATTSAAHHKHHHHLPTQQQQHQHLRHGTFVPGHSPPPADPIQLSLDAVTRRLVRPGFLHNLTPSRLPSQAASDSSLSPHGEPPHSGRSARTSFGQHQAHLPHSSLNTFVSSQDVIHEIDLVAPLIQDPPATNADDEHHGVDDRVRSQLQTAFLSARRAYAKMAAERSFQSFSHRHQDLVLAVDFNYFGNRMVTAGSDHRLKVWDKKDDSWNLVESWKAHDAEIVDVKWNGPFMGEVVGSIGEDGRCKLWQEDLTEVPLSGSRFKLLTNLTSQSPAPFMSLDFKNIMQETWLALITRDGHLSVWEPLDQSSLNEWKIIADHQVCEPPERHEEAGFKVVFHKEKLPCWTAIMAGLDRKSLSLAVAAMNEVLIFRTDKSKRFFHIVTLQDARQVIRDVAWANGSMRGHDVIATASKDGSIRIYELSTVPAGKPATAASTSVPAVPESVTSPQIGRPRANPPSGIGAGLAFASQGPGSNRDTEQTQPGRVKQEAKLVDELTNHHGAVWRLAFSQMGDLLVSTGDDASIRTWKKAVNGHWTEYAEIETAQDR